MRILLLACVVLSVIAMASSLQACDRAPPQMYSNVREPLKQMPKDQIPQNFTWANVTGINYLTLTRQQHIPQYCGSCWAFAATSAFSDRIKIARQAKFPDINIAPQLLISCDKNPDDLGCEGGAHLSAYKFMHEQNVTDETCSIYQAVGWTNGLDCSDQVRCQNCWSGKGCWAQQTYSIYRVD